MTFRLRRGMVAEDGPGWAVIGADGEPLPGRWADRETAHEQGLLGVYLLSGVDLIEITAKPVYDPRSQSWKYKGWTFFGELGRYHIHGPNSTGRRARKVVGTYTAAVDYIDRTVG